jgi:cold-inducible RNA-binding protein
VEIYVSNLPYTCGDEDLLNLFKDFGRVTRAKVALDRDSGQSRGFGFVSMHESVEAQAAIEALNGQQLQGRTLAVRESVPKPPADLGGYVPPSRRPGFKGYGDKAR